MKAAITKIIKHIQQIHARKNARRQLHQMTNRSLADIGISRYDIDNLIK